jgi:hypothetical protein
MSSNSVTISQPVFALVDVNNFYVSCERAFNPNLINRQWWCSPIITAVRLLVP